ncbi:MAG TPA: inositol monophosphatase [Chloroflexi bacterium]|nr:inositol monophosphatase [Chloroflexota bacterium]
MNDHHFLSAASDMARAAGQLLQTMYASELEIALKNGNERDLVTTADYAADRLIRERLVAAFPEHAVFTEETFRPEAVIDWQTPTWIIDPLDGTTNFAHGLPIFSVSIALHDASGARVGVVYEPLRDWLFAARAGGGATLNGRPLQVSHQAQLRRSIVACDWSRSPEQRRASARIFNNFANEVRTLRSLGSAALGFCYVAAGCLDVYYNLSLWPWDVAAGELIAREAGATVTDEHGDSWTIETPGVLVSNGLVHAEAAAIVNCHWSKNGT